MRRSLVLLSFVPILGCSGPSDAPDAPGVTGTAASPSGSEVLRLKRVELVDSTGFGQPIVAMSFLAPVDWQMTGRVSWNPAAPCVFNLVSARAEVADPGSPRRFEIFPKYSSQWIADPQTNQIMGAGLPCHSAPPVSASDYVSQVFVPGFRSGATVLDLQARPEAARAMHQKILAYEGSDIARYQGTVQVEAVEGRIAYDGRSGRMEERLLATTTVATVPMTSATGGMTQMLSTFAEHVLGFSAPAGELDANSGLYGVMISSFRINPVWEKAVRDVMTAVNQRRVAGQLAAINAIRSQTGRLFDEWNRSIDRRDAEWTQRMHAQDRVFRNFTEAIRGTQTFADPHAPGGAWEMSNAYEYVWKSPTDEFVLTNDINFNPNVALQRNDWAQMKAIK
jgi:hypothetical protein